MFRWRPIATKARHINGREFEGPVIDYATNEEALAARTTEPTLKTCRAEGSFYLDVGPSDLVTADVEAQPESGPRYGFGYVNYQTPVVADFKTGDRVWAGEQEFVVRINESGERVLDPVIVVPPN